MILAYSRSSFKSVADKCGQLHENHSGFKLPRALLTKLKRVICTYKWINY